MSPDCGRAGSHNTPPESWLSRPGSPSGRHAHQTPAAGPAPWARSSPGSPTEQKTFTFTFNGYSFQNVSRQFKTKRHYFIHFT